MFCGNMTDLFGDWVDAEDRIDFIVRTLGYSRKATYLWLTKRPEALCDALSRGTMIPSDDPSCDIPFRNVEFCNQFFGFTGENQEWYDKRFKLWRALFPSWANGWLSAEPLLGPIDLHLGYIAPEDLPFKWIVVGCESGPKRRPCKISGWRTLLHRPCRVTYPCSSSSLPSTACARRTSRSSLRTSKSGKCRGKSTRRR